MKYNIGYELLINTKDKYLIMNSKIPFRKTHSLFSMLRMRVVYLPLLLFSFAACAETEPIDEDEVDPSINPPYTMDRDDDETEVEVGETGPTFPFFENAPLSFPGGEGYGRNATGARTTKTREVYRVTNLNDSGEGSFRDAVSKPNRFVVINVDGVVECSGTVVSLAENLTILGQTAPGDGIVLYGGAVSASGADNTIVRYMRFRMGPKNFSEGSKDALGVANGENMMFDHCSITWGRDECFSISDDGKGTSPRNITIQNSIVGQGLQNHSCGGLLQTSKDRGVTVFRCLYIDSKTRNPKVKGLNQFVNNVVYNWGNGAAYNMSGDSQGESETTIEDNYFIVGPGNNWLNTQQADGSLAYELGVVSPTKPFIEGNELFRTYLNGNMYDNNKNGVLDGHLLDRSEWSGEPTILSAPSSLHPHIYSQTNATEAYNYIVEHVGASLPARDQVDAFLIDELTSLGTKGTIIGKPADTNQFPIGGCGTFKSGTLPLDTDGDGMPDDFEDKWGLDKNDPKDAVKDAANGYTNIENYALSLEYPEEYEKAWKESNNK